MTSNPSGAGSVCVCVADQAYLEYVRHVFVSVRRLGWNDDLLLITGQDNPPDTLDWFRSNGVAVWELPHLIAEADWIARQPAGHNPITLHKLYLFTERMKQWRQVVFLDADIILRRSITRLTEVTGFAACDDLFHSLAEQLKDPAEAPRLTEEGYDLSRTSFNTGVMAFSTDILDGALEQRLHELTRRYFGASRWGDQLIVNLLFYGRWRTLPVGYNFFPALMQAPGDIPAWAFVWHFPDQNQPWKESSPYHAQWLRAGEEGMPRAASGISAVLLEWYWRLCPRGLALTGPGRQLRAWWRARKQSSHK